MSLQELQFIHVIVVQLGGKPYSLSENEDREMKKFALLFWKDESGATAIEYGLIAAGISIAIIVAVNGLGTNLNAKFSSVNNSLK